MGGLVAKWCARHPDRPGAAVCMACGAVVCQECTTTWEGINHCAACLARRGRSEPRRTTGLGVVSWALACLVLLVLAAELAVSTGLLLVGWASPAGTP